MAAAEEEEAEAGDLRRRRREIVVSDTYDQDFLFILLIGIRLLDRIDGSVAVLDLRGDPIQVSSPFFVFVRGALLPVPQE